VSKTTTRTSTKHTMIISGGQTGADRAALNAQRPVATSSFATTRPSIPVALPKLTRPKQPLTSHHVEDPNALAVKTIKDPAGSLDNVPVSRATELGRDGSAFGVPFQFFDMFKDALDETASGLGVVEGDIIRDCVQISQCWLGPDYLSHRASRFFAAAWGTARPSSSARSPRAIPRSISSCFWRSSYVSTFTKVSGRLAILGNQDRRFFILQFRENLSGLAFQRGDEFRAHQVILK
jgi:hypothetical protein